MESTLGVQELLRHRTEQMGGGFVAGWLSQSLAAGAGAQALQVARDQCLCFPCCRYSASTVDALEMMDDDKVDLDLIAALIKHIVLEEEVQWD